jgi:hypothetical protein
MMKLAIFLTLFSLVGQVHAQNIFNCKTKKDEKVVLKIDNDGNAFSLNKGQITYNFIKSDDLDEYVNNDYDLIYRDVDRGWSRDPWFNLPSYDSYKTFFEFDKQTGKGKFYSSHKDGLISLASVEKIKFTCEIE